jgi:hypothetical protein
MNKLVKIFKKKIHPLIGYAFIFGAGAIGLNATAADSPVIAVAEAPQNTVAVNANETAYVDFSAVKIAAAQINLELAEINKNIDRLKVTGHLPPQELQDALGRAKQLVEIIAKSESAAALGGIDAVAALQQVSRDIAKFSEF